MGKFKIISTEKIPEGSPARVMEDWMGEGEGGGKRACLMMCTDERDAQFFLGGSDERMAALILAAMHSNERFCGIMEMVLGELEASASEGEEICRMLDEAVKASTRSGRREVS